MAPRSNAGALVYGFQYFLCMAYSLLFFTSVRMNFILLVNMKNI